ncbi:helix-hairpin-helix domain-containing protein [Candidatus Peregrinibacteria bacterium]|nr:helix-hairpin-helix domain-containing protein [Candidatus Peregrinibacteria bacterium]
MLSLDLKDRFAEIADILELSNESFFKIRAYRTASSVVSGLSEDILKNSSQAELKKIRGIGDAIAQKIVEYRETGHIAALEKMKQGLPDGILELLNIPGLGPKTLKKFWFEFGVKNLSLLKKLLKSGQVEKLPHFGEKSVENLKKGIEFFEKNEQRIPYTEAKEKADEILKNMKKCHEMLKIEIAGSLRRKKEMIGDIDILVSSVHPEKVIDFFLKLEIVGEVNAHGETKASIFTKDHRQIDLRVVPPESFGSALQYFTGSKEHNILLRRIALKKRMKLSEYGVFLGEKKIAGETEEGVYEILGKKWISPEKRLGKDELHG